MIDMGGQLVSPAAFIKQVKGASSLVNRGKRVLQPPKVTCKLLEGSGLIALAPHLAHFRDSLLPAGPRVSVGDILQNAELLSSCHPVGVVVYDVVKEAKNIAKKSKVVDITPDNIRNAQQRIEAFFLGAPYSEVKSFLGLTVPRESILARKPEDIFYMSDMYADPYLHGMIGKYFQGWTHQLLSGNYNWILYSSVTDLRAKLARRFGASSFGQDNQGNEFFVMPVAPLATGKRKRNIEIGPEARIIQLYRPNQPSRPEKPKPVKLPALSRPNNELMDTIVRLAVVFADLYPDNVAYRLDKPNIKKIAPAVLEESVLYLLFSDQPKLAENAIAACGHLKISKAIPFLTRVLCRPGDSLDDSQRLALDALKSIGRKELAKYPAEEASLQAAANYRSYSYALDARGRRPDADRIDLQKDLSWFFKNT